MMACFCRSYQQMLEQISQYDYSVKNKLTDHTELRQCKCPNCGAKLDTRRYIPDGYIENHNGEKQYLYCERNHVKCEFCRSEFELCGKEE